jgi:Tfp pilus assembly protein PilF
MSVSKRPGDGPKVIERARRATPARRGLAWLAPRHSLIAWVVLVSTLSGCANWRPQAKEATLSDARQARHAMAVQAFEQQRDEAQLKAALDRWQQGDIAGCESRLRNLVQRRPEYCDPHVHLAELAWSHDNADEAISEFRAALALVPQRADVHHALGLILEATGQLAEAQHHLTQAATLDPTSDLYRAAAGLIATNQSPTPTEPTGLPATR